MTKGFIIRTDWTTDYIEVSGYDDIRNVVGGYIEAVHFGENQYFCYANEEAKIIGLDSNELASAIWYDSGQRILLGDYIAGDVIFFGGIDDEGNDIDIPNDFHLKLMRYD